MSPVYLEAVSTHLPGATIVFDHFHVIKLFNDRLSDLRRGLAVLFPRGGVGLQLRERGGVLPVLDQDLRGGALKLVEVPVCGRQDGGRAQPV